MVAIAQLVERQIVVLDVAGSSPVSHPLKRALSANPVDKAFSFAASMRSHPLSRDRTSNTYTVLSKNRQDRPDSRHLRESLNFNEL